ncbi:hypothetical protein GCM10023156_22960 [Novipirellula rosea]|uniref:Uncharacterized protein n=1 Tax=Novipirellula rosea TaxID=1031540 RepID=A0ABP8MPT9_9BACT
MCKTISALPHNNAAESVEATSPRQQNRASQRPQNRGTAQAIYDDCQIDTAERLLLGRSTLFYEALGRVLESLSAVNFDTKSLERCGSPGVRRTDAARGTARPSDLLDYSKCV